MYCIFSFLFLLLLNKILSETIELELDLGKTYTYNNDNRKNEQLDRNWSGFGLYVYDLDE